MLPYRSGCLFVVLLCLTPAAARAEWPNLNPFSSGSGSSSGQSGGYWYPGKYLSSGWSGSGQSQGSNWSILPKSQPTFGQPSTFNRMMNGTKEAIYDAADFLNPFYSRPKYPGPFAPTGNSSFLNQNRTPVNAKMEKERAPWWMPYDYPEEDERPQTVSDFLKQERP